MYFLTLGNSLGQTYLCFKVYKNISHQNYFFNKYFALTKQKYTRPGAYFFSTICNCLCIKTKFHMLFIYWNIHSASENPTVLVVCTLSALLSSGLRDVALDRSFAWLLGNTNLISMSFVTGPLKGFTELLTNGLRFGIFTVTDPRGHRKFLFFFVNLESSQPLARRIWTYRDGRVELGCKFFHSEQQLNGVLLGPSTSSQINIYFWSLGCNHHRTYSLYYPLQFN